MPTSVPGGHVMSGSAMGTSGQERASHESTRNLPSQGATVRQPVDGIVFPPPQYVNLPGSHQNGRQIPQHAYMHPSTTAGGYATNEPSEGIVFPPKTCRGRAKLTESTRDQWQQVYQNPPGSASHGAAATGCTNPRSIVPGSPVKCLRQGCTYMGLPEHRGFCSKHLKEYIDQDGRQAEQLYDDITAMPGYSPPSTISYGEGVPGQRYDENAVLVTPEEHGRHYNDAHAHRESPAPRSHSTGGHRDPSRRCEFSLGDIYKDPLSERNAQYVDMSKQSLEDRQLYNEVTSKGDLPHNYSNISYGEGVPGQIDDNPMVTPEIIQGVPRRQRSVRDQHETTSHSLPNTLSHSASFTASSTTPKRIPPRQSSFSAHTSPEWGYPWKRGRYAATPPHADLPLRSPCRVQDCSNKGEPGLAYHCTRCSYYNRINMPPTPEFEMDKRFASPEKGRLNIPERPVSLDIPRKTSQQTEMKTVAQQQQQNVTLTEEDLEDYNTVVKNIQDVSQNAVRKCRTEGCTNFGNKGANWFCNACFKHRCSPRAHSGTCSMPCAKCIWDTVPVSIEEEMPPDEDRPPSRARRPSEQRLAFPSPMRPTTRKGSADTQLQSLMKIKRFYCKRHPDCSNYGSDDNDGYCNSCYQLHAV